MAMGDDWREAMNKKRKEGKFCDFKIMVAGQTFPVHRIVLDTFSHYFATMFATEMREAQEGRCKIDGFTAHTGKVCIDFLYTGKLDLTKDTVVEILKLCHVWQLEKAVEICETFLAENLDGSFFVTTRNLASLYGLEKLEAECNNYLSRHLDEITTISGIRDLSFKVVKDFLLESQIKTSNPTQEEAEISINSLHLWRFAIFWGKGQEDSKIICEIIKAFPIDLLSNTEFLSTLRYDEHLNSCKNCKRSVATAFFATRKFIVNEYNCLWLKKIAKQCGIKHVEDTCDKEIIRHHKNLFTGPEFLEIETKDLLQYVQNIQEECSVQVFGYLMKWMKHSPERHDLFPEIFENRSNDHSVFLRSIREIWDLEDRPKSNRPGGKLMTLFSGIFSRYEPAPLKGNCYFVKTLSQKYCCIETEKKVDAFIIKYFVSLSKNSGYLQLSASDVTKYISDPEIYEQWSPSGVWKALMRWVEHDIINRSADFLKIFQVLPLDRFSISFLRDTICETNLVKNSSACSNRLIANLFQRFDGIEERVRKLENKKS